MNAKNEIGADNVVDTEYRHFTDWDSAVLCEEDDMEPSDLISVDGEGDIDGDSLARLGQGDRPAWQAIERYKENLWLRRQLAEFWE